MTADERLSTTSRTSNMMPDVTNVLSPCFSYNSSSLWLIRNTRSLRRVVSQSLCCTGNCNLVSCKRRDHPQLRGVAVVNGGQDGMCFHVGTAIYELGFIFRISEAFKSYHVACTIFRLFISLNPHVIMNNMHAAV